MNNNHEEYINPHMVLSNITPPIPLTSGKVWNFETSAQTDFTTWRPLVTVRWLSVRQGTRTTSGRTVSLEYGSVDVSHVLDWHVETGTGDKPGAKFWACRVSPELAMEAKRLLPSVKDKSWAIGMVVTAERVTHPFVHTWPPGDASLPIIPALVQTSHFELAWWVKYQIGGSDAGPQHVASPNIALPFVPERLGNAPITDSQPKVMRRTAAKRQRKAGSSLSEAATIPSTHTSSGSFVPSLTDRDDDNRTPCGRQEQLTEEDMERFFQELQIFSDSSALRDAVLDASRQEQERLFGASSEGKVSRVFSNYDRINPRLEPDYAWKKGRPQSLPARFPQYDRYTITTSLPCNLEHVTLLLKSAWNDESRSARVDVQVRRTNNGLVCVDFFPPFPFNRQLTVAIYQDSMCSEPPLVQPCIVDFCYSIDQLLPREYNAFLVQAQEAGIDVRLPQGYTWPVVSWAQSSTVGADVTLGHFQMWSTRIHELYVKYDCSSRFELRCADEFTRRKPQLVHRHHHS